MESTLMWNQHFNGVRTWFFLPKWDLELFTGRTLHCGGGGQPQHLNHLLHEAENRRGHYHDVTMSAMASQITSLTIVYSTVYLDDQRKHQSSTSLAFVPVNSPYKWPVTRKMFPFDDFIMGAVHAMLTHVIKNIDEPMKEYSMKWFHNGVGC